MLWRVIDSIKNILLLFCRREFYDFQEKKKGSLVANLSEVIFIDEQCWHLEQTTLSGFKTLFIKKGSLSHKLLAILWNWKKSSKS